MRQEAGDILKYRNSDLQKERQEHHEVAKVPILAICPSLGPSAAPVRAREPTNQDPWSALEEIRPSVDGAYVKEAIGALEVR